MSALSIITIIIATVVIAVGGNRRFQHLGWLDRPGADVPKRDAVPCYQGVFVLIALLVASGFVSGTWDTAVGQALMIGTIVLG